MQFKRSIREDYLEHVKPIDLEECRGIWVVGSPGVGKSHWARITRLRELGLEKKDLYVKPLSKWWDGYGGE